MAEPIPIHIADRPIHAVMETNPTEPFRILQLTDFHTDASEHANTQTWRDAHLLIGHCEPDLLAVTGDIWCADGLPEHEALAGMKRDLALLGDLGVPWAFTWGNHDYADELTLAHERIAATPHAVAPRGDGEGNYRVTIINHESGAPLWDLFFLNSHTESLLDSDVSWLERECAVLRHKRGCDLPAIAYFHIPLKPYEEARLAGAYRGIALEEVLFWGDDGSLFPRIRDAGGIRACFVGHSHVNDFATEKDGVLLAYGRATGHGGYGGDRLNRGGKVVDLDPVSGSFDCYTLFPDGSVWRF